LDPFGHGQQAMGGGISTARSVVQMAMTSTMIG
jgi:hypothetical protein